MQDLSKAEKRPDSADVAALRNRQSNSVDVRVKANPDVEMRSQGDMVRNIDGLQPMQQMNKANSVRVLQPSKNPGVKAEAPKIQPPPVAN